MYHDTALLKYIDVCHQMANTFVLLLKKAHHCVETYTSQNLFKMRNSEGDHNSTTHTHTQGATLFSV